MYEIVDTQAKLYPNYFNLHVSEHSTISIFYRSKAKIDDKSVWNRLGWNPNRVKYKDAFHQKCTVYSCKWAF